MWPEPQKPGECHLYLAHGCHLYIAATQCVAPRLKRHFFSPLEMSLDARSLRHSFSIRAAFQFGSEAPAFPSRPDNSNAAARSGGDGRSGAARSHAQRPLRREHGEAGEHQTFPAASTVAALAQARGIGGEAGSSRFSRVTRRIPVPPRPRFGVTAVPLSAGPALPSCSAAVAAPGDGDAGAARKCPGTA